MNLIKNFKKVVWLFAFLFIYLLRLQFLPHLNLRDGQTVRVTGTLAEEPQVSGNLQKFKMGQIEVWTDRYPEYHYGDQLEIIGRVKVVSARGRLVEIFPKDYLLNYPEIKRIDLTVDLPLSTLNLPLKTAINLKNQLKKVYQQSLPSPLDGILTGIVLGDKSLIPYQFWQVLKQTGTLHIMVASGMNIAMFSGTVLSFLTLFFKRWMAIIFLFITIWFYSLMTGLQPPIVRAAIMASLVYLCQLVGREADSGRILWLTGGLMLLANPLWLFDLGFQLSFSATAGLVYLQPWLQRYPFLRNETLSSSLAAQAATLPILVVCFGQLNVLSPLINLFILWTIPLILQGGLLVGGLGLLWPGLGRLAAYLLYPLLFYLERSLYLWAKIKL